MSTKVKINYLSDTKKLKISVDDKEFDTSRINGKDISEWAYPFIIKNIHWNGIYDELSEFLGEKEFNIQFDGDTASYEILKNAVSGKPVKVAGTDNKVVILYKKEPLSTIITVNGKKFDTSKLQNRYIDEWISPFQFRDVKWDGIFKELENFIGIDVYTIQFSGDQDDMKELMKKCPENVSIIYKALGTVSTPKTKFVKKQSASATGETANNSPISESTVSSQSVDTSSVSKFAEDTVSMMKQDISDEEINQNLNNIPIKNEFIRKNIMAICAAISIILGLLPFIKYSCKVTASGDFADEIASTGSTEQTFNLFQLLSGDINSFFTIVLFIIPILLIIMNYIKPLRPYRRAIAIIAPALSFISEIILFFIIRATCISNAKTSSGGGDDFSMSTKIHTIPHIGFYLLLVSYILTAVVGFITYYGMKIPDKLPIKKK